MRAGTVADGLIRMEWSSPMHKIAGRILLASIITMAGGFAVAQDQAVFQPHCTTVQADGANGALTALCDTGPLNAGR
eukprot:gene46014-58979_t